jgi:hypothetical protein
MFVAVLHDGARVPYCAKHLPNWKEPKEDAYEKLMRALRKALKR